MIVSKAIRLGQIALDDGDIFWAEMRPEENGRNVVVCHDVSGNGKDVTPTPFNVRTRVHEYGGGAVAVNDHTIYFSNYSDQRVYRQIMGGVPEAVTPDGPLRFADGVFDTARDHLICVREDHSESDQDADNTIVSLKLDGKDRGTILVSLPFAIQF